MSFKLYIPVPSVLLVTVMFLPFNIVLDSHVCFTQTKYCTSIPGGGLQYHAQFSTYKNLVCLKGANVSEKHSSITDILCTSPWCKIFKFPPTTTIVTYAMGGGRNGSEEKNILIILLKSVILHAIILSSRVRPWRGLNKAAN